MNKLMKNPAMFLVVTTGLILVLFTCIYYLRGDNKKAYTAKCYAMDTYNTITIYSSAREETQTVAVAAADLIEYYDGLWSATEPGSLIYQLNEKHGAEVDQDTYELLVKAETIYEQTGGAFDPSTYPLTELWGFTSTPSRPKEEEIIKTRDHCGFDRVKLSDGLEKGKYTITLEEGMKLGLGAIAKGYATDKIVAELKKAGEATALLSLGGNVYAMGYKNSNGEKWNIGVKNPYSDGKEYLCVLKALDVAVVTSAGYERNFTDEDGNTWHHIIDPKTGYSADKGLISVTIVSPDATLADALSTAIFVMGLSEAEEFWHEYGDNFEMILAARDSVYITKGLLGQISGDYEYNVIE